MRRAIILASCLAALCLAALAGWLYGRRGSQGETSTRVVDAGSQKTSKPTHSTAKEAMDKRVFALNDRYVMFGEDQFKPCYVDRENKTLYWWKEIVLRLDQLAEQRPYRGFYPVLVAYDHPNLSNFSADIIVKDYAVVPVEAPVKYRVTDKYNRVGFYFRSRRVFYMWKGMAISDHELLDKSQDGQPAILKLSKINQVIEIDQPAYLKQRPKLWKIYRTR